MRRVAGQRKREIKSYPTCTNIHKLKLIHILFTIHNLWMTSEDVQRHSTFGFRCTFLKRQHHFKPSRFKYVVQFMFISFAVFAMHRRSWNEPKEKKKKKAQIQYAFLLHFFAALSSNCFAFPSFSFALFHTFNLCCLMVVVVTFSSSSPPLFFSLHF